VNVAGFTLLRDGVGFHNVTELVAVALESAAAVPLIVMPLEFGRFAGAVYIPAVEIVPVEALPPTTPFTDQFTVLFALPVTIAVKGCVEPARTLAVPGAILIEVLAGDGGGAGAPVDAVFTQPAVYAAMRNKAKQRYALRKACLPVSNELKTQLSMMMRVR
jgi:hypothetical protein